MTKKKKPKKKVIEHTCDVCEQPIFINFNIYKLTGLCGVCATGESELLYTNED